MAELRYARSTRVFTVLKRSLLTLEKLSKKERMEIARAFTLMLELMNACENAFRSYRLQTHPKTRPGRNPDSIIFVLTAHPTEARSPENIWIFHIE